ncbi:MAG TPA: hypothetical protein VJ464_16750 [Blastocatellia bacterium]|nr:hypothetical protein [Blastocatellia bacterium]
MKEKIILIVVGGLSILIALSHMIGLLELVPWLEHRIPVFTLLVVGVVAEYLAFENKKKLDSIERLVRDGEAKIIRSLNGVEVRYFEHVSQVYEYAHKRMLEAKNSIDDLTWGDADHFETPDHRQAHEEYIRDIAEISSKKNFRYREVMTFPNIERLRRAEAMITNNKAKGYQLKYYEIPPQGMPPLMEFLLIDSEEVIFAFYKWPYSPTSIQFHLAVKHPDIVKLLEDYYTAVWENPNAKKLKVDDQVNGAALEEIKDLFKPRETIKDKNTP